MLPLEIARLFAKCLKHEEHCFHLSVFYKKISVSERANFVSLDLQRRGGNIPMLFLDGGPCPLPLSNGLG